MASPAYRGKTADQILENQFVNHSSWHFVQGMSWLDFAKRKRSPQALHYAAFDCRYGIEYLLFELLVLANRGLTQAEYQKCVGNPQAMKKMLRHQKAPYEKLAEFTKIVLSLDKNSPTLRYWDLNELFAFWGRASELLHFVGEHSRTY